MTVIPIPPLLRRIFDAFPLYKLKNADPPWSYLEGDCILFVNDTPRSLQWKIIFRLKKIDYIERQSTMIDLPLLWSHGKVIRSKNLADWAQDKLSVEEKSFLILIERYLEPLFLVTHKPKDNWKNCLTGSTMPANFMSLDDFIADADSAIAALSAYLGDDNYFASAPGILDAATAAYVFYLSEHLKMPRNLLLHAERVYVT